MADDLDTLAKLGAALMLQRLNEAMDAMAAAIEFIDALPLPEGHALRVAAGRMEEALEEMGPWVLERDDD